MNYHETLVEKVKAAVNELFGDKSVPAATTLDSLEEIRDDLEAFISVLRSERGDAIR
jgi:hypothetical protein